MEHKYFLVLLMTLSWTDVNGNIFNPPEDLDVEQRINGAEDKDNMMPFVASLTINFIDGFGEKQPKYCSGTLISFRHILSAAMCFRHGTNEIKNTEVTLQTRGRERLNALHITTDSIKINDSNQLAMVLLPREAFPPPRGMKMALLPMPWSNLKDTFTAAGFNKDKKMFHTKVTKGTCPAGTVKETICINKKSLCDVDIGGPLLESIFRWPRVIVGVANSGDINCEGNEYISVRENLNWIKQQLRRRPF